MSGLVLAIIGFLASCKSAGESVLTGFLEYNRNDNKYSGDKQHYEK
jgi:hypothetical protein